MYNIYNILIYINIYNIQYINNNNNNILIIILIIIVNIKYNVKYQQFLTMLLKRI